MLPGATDTRLATLESIIAEARLLRGMTYFRLISMWGDVPYIGRIIYDNSEVKDIKRMPITQVKDSILADFNYAVNSGNTVNFTNNSKNINLKCLSVHIGSQILDHKPYEKMLNVVNKIIKKSGHIFEFIDLGGGMGISYEKNSKKLNYQKYNIAIQKFLKDQKT